MVHPVTASFQLPSRPLSAVCQKDRQFIERSFLLWVDRTLSYLSKKLMTTELHDKNPWTQPPSATTEWKTSITLYTWYAHDGWNAVRSIISSKPTPIWPPRRRIRTNENQKVMSRISEQLLPFIACKTLRNKPKQNGFHVLVVLIEMWECADETIQNPLPPRARRYENLWKSIREEKNIYRIQSMQVVQCRPQHTLRVEAVFKA